MSKRNVTAFIHNQNGVLTRLMGLFTKHQFQIESLSLGLTEVDGVSKMTVLVGVEDDHKFIQLVKQLNKQIDVLFVTDKVDENIVAKELAQLKVDTDSRTFVTLN
jgi:acetolactate synthase I/III small subunit